MFLSALVTLQHRSFNMAISPSIISQAIKAASPSLNGKEWIDCCSALGKALYKEIVNPKTVYLNGNTVGVAGAGAIPSGKVFFVPIPDMKSHLKANRVKGVVANQVAIGCIVGVTNALNASCEYYGSSVGVCIGSDISRVVFANPTALSKSVQSILVAYGLKGIVAKNTAKGIGNGISSILLSGTGAAPVTGSPSPVPSSGTSVCFLR